MSDAINTVSKENPDFSTPFTLNVDVSADTDTLEVGKAYDFSLNVIITDPLKRKEVIENICFIVDTSNDVKLRYKHKPFSKMEFVPDEKDASISKARNSFTLSAHSAGDVELLFCMMQNFKPLCSMPLHLKAAALKI